MSNSLLSHIATNFIQEYENVANSSIVYLLNTYPAAHRALKDRLDFVNIPTYFETEYDTKGNGRPDVVGKDINGDITLIIEGKFWANLTENQPGNYLNVLHSEGKMLFLCPDRRKESLKFEVNNLLSQPDDRLMIMSWDELLRLIEQENSTDYDPQLASDLLQMKELCDKMDEEGMPPLSSSDLSPMIGRITYQFSDLINDCNKQLRSWDESDFKGMKTTGNQEGYGFYFKALGFGCRLEFSSYDWFTRSSHTPYWLCIWDIDFNEDKDAYHCLRAYDQDNTYEKNNYAIYGITLKPGMDRSEIIEHLVTKTKETLLSLHSCKENRR